MKPSNWLAALCVLAAATAQADAEGTTYALYFMGGQSNMLGYGQVDELPEALRTAVPGARIFNGNPTSDNTPGGGAGLWSPLGPGFGVGFQTDGKQNHLSDRFGPELAFGRTLSELTGEPIAIIKYALGGSALAAGIGYGNWAPDFDVEAGINQYDHALATIHSALASRDIDGDGHPDQLVPTGIIWMQGESDANASAEVAGAYGANQRRLMDLLRAALHRDDLPVVIGRINDSFMGEDGTATQPYIDQVHAAQAEFAASDACAAYVTETKDYAFSDDAWHYVSSDYVRMGNAFARAAFNLGKRCGIGAE